MPPRRGALGDRLCKLDIVGIAPVLHGRVKGRDLAVRQMHAEDPRGETVGAPQRRGDKLHLARGQGVPKRLNERVTVV